MSNFDIANIALQSVCPNNEMLYDDKGMPSVMVKIPKCTWADLGIGTSTETFPAFIVNGVEKDCIYFSKYQNIVQNSRAYSLPGQDPGNSITLDTSISRCTAKGEGWHLQTRLEWMAVALWCLKNGTQPKGNNNYGRDSTETVYKAIPSTARDSSNRIQRVVISRLGHNGINIRIGSKNTKVLILTHHVDGTLVHFNCFFWLKQ